MTHTQRNRRRLGAMLAGLLPALALTTGLVAPAAGAATLPDHGVDRNGFCTPRYIGNRDCIHNTETRYQPAACRQLDYELSYNGSANCLILPPDGKGIIQAYTPSCKQSESIEDCRRRLHTKPVVMQPGNW